MISPAAQGWIAERWEETLAGLDEVKTAPLAEAQDALTKFQSRRMREMSVQEMVSWLADHFHHLTQEDIASILSVSQPLVGRYLRVRSTRRSQLMVTRAKPLV